MIDTITLKISDRNFVLFDPDQHFGKMKYQEFKGKFGIFGKHWSRYTDYPQRQKKLGRYFPQVTVVCTEKRLQGGGTDNDRWLVIQVSAPKLVYGTSLFDITEEMLPLFAQRLTERLLEINIKTEPEKILNSVVQRLDCSKILRISPSYGHTKQIIEELSKYDLKQSSDFNRHNYHSGKDGQYLKFWNSSRGLVIYDKFDEIMANGTTNLEREIARQYMAGKWKSGALRIEVSLQLKQTLEATIRKYGGYEKRKDFTLAEVAKTKIAKAVLLEGFRSVYMDGYSGVVRLGGLKDVELDQAVSKACDSYRDRALIFYLTHRVRKIGLKAAVAELKAASSPTTAGRHKRTLSAILASLGAKKGSVDMIGYLYRKMEKFTPILPKELDRILKK